MKFAVFGTGGVGGYFGGRLAAAGEEVTFLARGDNVAALQREGLTIESPDGDARIPSVAATDRPEDVGPVDVVLFTVKLYDLDQAAKGLTALVGPGTVVLALQNGVEVVEMLSRHVGREHIVPGAAYVVAAIDAPGRVRHTSGGRIVFGAPDGSRSQRLTAIQAAGRSAGFRADISESIETELWTKFVRLTTWSGMTALARSPIGVIRESPALTRMMEAALAEGIEVARARGIPIPDAVTAETLDLVRGFPFDTKSSMLVDLEMGRRLELPWLSGAVARFGEEAGVAAPTHRFIATALEPFVDPRRRGQANRASMVRS